MSLNLPFGLGGVDLVDDESQKLAAWELYVEYSTRITTQKLTPNTGSIREALSSLHSLFEITRSVLKNKGPGTIDSENSVGVIAIKVLNEGVRPFLVKWHTLLSRYENDQLMKLQRKLGPGVVADKDLSGWEHKAAFYKELEDRRKNLVKFVNVLGKIAGVSFKAKLGKR